MKMIDAATFKAATGFNPQEDDLERCNCPKAGQMGHYACGWNSLKNKPVFIAGPEHEIVIT